LFEFCSQRIRALLYLFGDLVMVVVAVFALILSFESLLVSLKFGSVSHGLRLPMSLFLCAVPIGFALMLFRLAQSICRDLRNIKNNDATYEGGRLFD